MLFINTLFGELESDSLFTMEMERMDPYLYHSAFLGEFLIKQLGESAPFE